MAGKGERKRNYLDFIGDFFKEVKKVVWPTPKELVNNTVAVIAFVIIIAIIVFVCDFFFYNLNKYAIKNFQEKVQ